MRRLPPLILIALCLAGCGHRPATTEPGWSKFAWKDGGYHFLFRTPNPAKQLDSNGMQLVVRGADAEKGTLNPGVYTTMSSMSMPTNLVILKRVAPGYNVKYYLGKTKYTMPGVWTDRVIVTLNGHVITDHPIQITVK